MNEFYKKKILLNVLNDIYYHGTTIFIRFAKENHVIYGVDEFRSYTKI